MELIRLRHREEESMDMTMRTLMENKIMDLTNFKMAFLAAALMTTTPALAELPHTFSAGEAASASQVNANFQDLDGKISAMPVPVQYDMAAFSRPEFITNKVFSNKQTNERPDASTAENGTTSISRCDQMILTVPNATTEVYKGTGPVTAEAMNEFCWEERHLYQMIDGSRYYLGWEDYSIGFVGSSLELIKTSSSLFRSPIKLPTTITPSQAWGHSEIIEVQRYDPMHSTTETFDSVLIDTYTFMGIEDITVPAGTFNNCIKLHRDKTLGGRIEKRVRWQCPGIGTVKTLRTKMVIPDYTISGTSEPYAQSTVRELLTYQ